MKKQCPRCLEVRQMTHRVKSEFFTMEVCYQCGIDAEITQNGSRSDAPGNMTIQLFEAEPEEIAFECWVCHQHFPQAKDYFEHYYDSHP